MATVYTREWIQFFTGCGIPEDIASMYALIFYENRIQKNMLLDLNKEYLRDMGITVMGDVIAILRNAKIVHEKYIRAQILSGDNTIGDESIEETNTVAKKITPMKRMLEHYTRKYNPQESESLDDKITKKFKNIKNNEDISIIRPSKKKIIIAAKENVLDDKRLEVPVPKVRRVLPENEGGYKIKMPLGTTERSKKLLEQAKRRKAKTVFDRLGESSVSSTTSEISINSTSSSPLNREKINNSVFSRLGEKTSAVSSTSPVDDSDSVSLGQLPYAGILKGSISKKNLSNSTMRADEQLEVKNKNGVSVKKRLGGGLSEPKEETPSKRIMLKGVRRIGNKATVNTPTSRLNSTQIEVKNNTGNLVIRKNVTIAKKSQEATRTIQTQKTKAVAVKRRMDEDLEMNPLKKVRFGRTTHRLIPSTPSSTDPVSYVRNYPKLTMIINNRANAKENNTLSSGIKIGSLNSDNVEDKVGVKARIGKKSLKGRLGQKMNVSVQGTPRRSKPSTVKERLG